MPAFQTHRKTMRTRLAISSPPSVRLAAKAATLGAVSCAIETACIAMCVCSMATCLFVAATLAKSSGLSDHFLTALKILSLPFPVAALPHADEILRAGLSAIPDWVSPPASSDPLFVPYCSLALLAFALPPIMALTASSLLSPVAETLAQSGIEAEKSAKAEASQSSCLMEESFLVRKCPHAGRGSAPPPSSI